MAYAVVADLVAKFGDRELIQLTDRSTPPADAIDPTVIQPALDAAAALIDGYVGSKYALPLGTTPPLLVSLNCDLARFDLFADQATDVVKDRRKMAIETLRDIASGKIKIDAAGVEPPSRADNIETSGPCRQFTRCSMGGF